MAPGSLERHVEDLKTGESSSWAPGTSNGHWAQRRAFFVSSDGHWIGLRESLQETMGTEQFSSLPMVFFSWIVDIPIAKDIFRTKLFIQG